MKNMYFFNNISNIFNFTSYFFTFYFIQLTSCVSISIIVWLNKKFILINKVGSKIYVTWSNIFIYKCFLIFSIYVS